MSLGIAACIFKVKIWTEYPNGTNVPSAIYDAVVAKDDIDAREWAKADFESGTNEIIVLCETSVIAVIDNVVFPIKQETFDDSDPYEAVAYMLRPDAD